MYAYIGAISIFKAYHKARISYEKIGPSDIILIYIFRLSVSM